MPVHLVQDNPATMRFVYEGQWTWDEFYPAINEMTALLDKRDTIVHQIIDLRSSAHLPAGALRHLSSIKYTDHPRLGITVILGANTFLRAMASMMMRLRPSLGQKLVFARTLEEAQTHLAQRQP